MAAAKGDPVGVHDVRIARVDGQRLLPPAGRSAVAPGLLRLLHVRPPFRYDVPQGLSSSMLPAAVSWTARGRLGPGSGGGTLSARSTACGRVACCHAEEKARL